ncbi:phage terminase small subunit P27 family [Salicibibacter cibarius]|uniref:Phage terminase small subunit P27 family n=1 Tax=Salicibibacter cibarius TaxID=2743000 RepID=A0A7T6Z1I1_9BACI|nr:phage terminase small subunit P27 family [Salicibibacter cibarius]QQK75083.1 phage terminase small subunit P27 family [Salicibibacter cibarius]QQK75144.1 phage terminase small subunit P27 family [Salicibibacter cibarius]
MGKRGPAPKPTNLKVMEGNPGKRPLNENEPEPTKETPECPEWLTDEAKEEWDRVVPELERLGLLTVVDGASLASYCASWARAVEAESWMAKNGRYYVTRDKDGDIKSMSKVPHVAIAEKSFAEVRAFAKEFGLTPSSRSELSAVAKDEKKSPMAEFLERKKNGS